MNTGLRSFSYRFWDRISFLMTLYTIYLSRRTCAHFSIKSYRNLKKHWFFSFVIFWKIITIYVSRIHMPSFKEKFGKLTKIQQFSWNSIYARRGDYALELLRYAVEEAFFERRRAAVRSRDCRIRVNNLNF